MLNSPHVVRIFDLQETDEGDLYLVMEFLDGEDLAQTLNRQGRLPLQQTTDYALQILDVLVEAHALGVVHRDLKPHNIFICRREGQPDLVKVFDFGIAKVTGTDDGSGLRETTKLTIQGGVVGTPTYMSPEQCRGEDLTPASDIYSLGIVLYQLLTGHVPFEDANPVQVMMMHHASPAPPLPAESAQTPLGRAVMKALAKEAGQRFQTAAEFRAAIAEPDEGNEKPVEKPVATAITKPQVSETSDAKAKGIAKKKRSRVYGSIVAVLIVVLCLLLLLSQFL
jgi:serine/threonine protein kinase